MPSDLSCHSPCFGRRRRFSEERSVAAVTEHLPEQAARLSVMATSHENRRTGAPFTVQLPWLLST